MIPIIHADITPLAINRTAMYYVVQDTLREIVKRDLPLECSALGIRIPLASLIKNDFCLTEENDREIMSRLQKCIADRNLLKLGQCTWDIDSPCQDGVTLTFDPLYLGFSIKRRRNISFVLDLTPVTRPMWHSPKVSALYVHAFNNLYDPSVEIISISQSTTRDLWANYGIPKSRVNTIYLYNRLEAKKVIRSPNPFAFLFVGSLEPRKNIETLARAFELSGLHSKGFSLRVVGQDGHNANHTREVCSKIPGVVLLGRLNDQDLAYEYQTCMCLVFPSLWEGFGLPALEAMAMDIPLLLSDSGALPEIGGLFADYVDPCDIESVKKGLCNVVQNKGGDKPEQGVEKIKWLAKFAKENYFKEIDALLRRNLNT